MARYARAWGAAQPRGHIWVSGTHREHAPAAGRVGKRGGGRYMWRLLFRASRRVGQLFEFRAREPRCPFRPLQPQRLEAAS